MFDANLSRKLTAALADVYPGSIHVSVLGPEPEDEAIWEYAKAGGFIVVSKDSDFYRMSVAWGAPPKVVWLRVGNSPTRLVEQVLRRHKADLEQFFTDNDAALLII